MGCDDVIVVLKNEWLREDEAQEGEAVSVFQPQLIISRTVAKKFFL